MHVYSISDGMAVCADTELGSIESVDRREGWTSQVWHTQGERDTVSLCVSVCVCLSSSE